MLRGMTERRYGRGEDLVKHAREEKSSIQKKSCLIGDVCGIDFQLSTHTGHDD
jgi:hypothetical protein